MHSIVTDLKIKRLFCLGLLPNEFDRPIGDGASTFRVFNDVGRLHLFCHAASDVSGVMFSRSPDDNEQVVIEAVYGLNQGLVDGTVEPDRWHVSIDNIKIFLSEDEDASADMSNAMEKYVKSSKLEELMKVKDGDTNLKFYIRQGKNEDHVVELLMFATGIDEEKHHRSGRHFETVLLTMSGDIDLTKVGALTNKMKLHKGLHKVDKN